MAERRRHKKRIQVTSLNWKKWLSVRLHEEQIKLLRWFATCCRTIIKSCIFMGRCLHAPDEARWWLAGVSLSRLAKTNVSICISVRRFRTCYAVRQHHSHTGPQSKTGRYLLANELCLLSAVLITIELAVNVCWLSCVSSRRVYITWGNMREFKLMSQHSAS